MVFRISLTHSIIGFIRISLNSYYCVTHGIVNFTNVWFSWYHSSRGITVLMVLMVSWSFRGSRDRSRGSRESNGDHEIV